MIDHRGADASEPFLAGLADLAAWTQSFQAPRGQFFWSTCQLLPVDLPLRMPEALTVEDLIGGQHSEQPSILVPNGSADGAGNYHVVIENEAGERAVLCLVGVVSQALQSLPVAIKHNYLSRFVLDSGFLKAGGLSPAMSKDLCISAAAAPLWRSACADYIEGLDDPASLFTASNSCLPNGVEGLEPTIFWHRLLAHGILYQLNHRDGYVDLFRDIQPILRSTARYQAQARARTEYLFVDFQRTSFRVSQGSQGVSVSVADLAGPSAAYFWEG